MSERHPAVRDLELGAALRELEVPEHRPEFHAQLHRLLAEERAARLGKARERRRRRAGLVRWSARTALVAAVGALAFVTLDVLRPADENQGSGIINVEAATAAEVKRTMRDALATLENMRGRLIQVAVDPQTGEKKTTRWSFAMTAEGDFRLDQIGSANDLAYDSETGVERSLNVAESAGAGRFAAERTGLAPGLPDPGPSDSIFQRELGSVVRALLAARDPRVTETVYEGRKAWQLDTAVRTNLIVPDADHFALTIDQETGVPVRFVATLDGSFRRELRVENLRVDSRLPADEFTVDLSRGTELNRTNEGFGRTSLDHVKGVVGYAPLVPGWVPGGYELTEVAAAAKPLTTSRSSSGEGYVQRQFTGAEAGNPPSEGVVSLSFTRGLDQFIVTTRLRHVPGAGDLWSDPLATGEGIRDEPQSVTARRGALSGVELKLLIVPRTVPHVWALTDELVVTVGGDLTRAELLRVAESLAARS